MARTTETKVKNVLSTSLTTIQINQFIDDASLWITEAFADESLSADRLELIERYLAAALIRLRDLGLKSAKFDDDLQEQYQVDPDVTDYLLRAASFDSTGIVRKHFLTPRDTRVASWRVGTTFQDDSE